MKKLILPLLLALSTVALTACFESKTENAIEDVGEKIEDTTDSAADKVEDAVDEVD